MKKNLLLIITIFITNFAFSQSTLINSDSPYFNINNNKVRIQNYSTLPFFTKSLTVSGNIAIGCDSSEAFLVASGSSCGYTWTSDNLILDTLSTNDSLHLYPIYNDTSVYLTTQNTDTMTLMPLSTYSNPYNGNVRGYYFTAPTNFTISGLRVPTYASSGSQSIAVVKFTAGAPPRYSSSTNSFIELGYWANYTLSDTIATCIKIDSGDIIGIYGSRSGINAYAPSGNTTINGFAVYFERSLMQDDLSTSAMHDISAGNTVGGSISLVDMFYDASPSITTTVNVTVPQSSYTYDSIVFCQGDSALVNGTYYFTDTTVIDSNLTIYNCDSISETSVITQNCTSISENKNNIVKTYPNPFSDNINIQFTDSDFAELNIYNTIGKLILNKNIEGLKSININTENLAKGIYILQLHNDSKINSYRIIKK